MASCSKKSAAKENLLGKRKLEDDLETKPSLKKHKETETTRGFVDDSLQQTKTSLDLSEKKSDETPDFVEQVVVPEKTLFVANLSSKTTVSDIIDFFKDVAQVVNALEEKNGEYLDDHKILLMKGLHETLDFVEEVAVRYKTLFVSKLSRKTEMSDIINFFKDVGEVVHIRLIVDHRGKPRGDGFVEFASANEAKMALEKKNGECLHNREIILEVFETPPPYYRRPRYCIDHKVWYEDYLQRESLVIEEEDAAAVEGLDETPDYTEEVSLQTKTVFVRELRGNIEMMNIIGIFKNAGEVIRVRLIVDRWGEHVGCCFVELATANAAKKAVQENRSYFLLNMAEMAAPHPFRPKYNLAEKLWYDDNLKRESLCGKEPKPKENKYKLYGKKTIISDEW